MKLKTKKAASKRVKRKKNSFQRKKAYQSHLLRKKDSKRLRSLCQSIEIHKSDFSSFCLMLPYSA